MFNRLRELMAKTPKNTFILVREGNYGIETYLNPLVSQFNKAYRHQLIAFLEGLLVQLKDGEDNKKHR